MAGEAHTGGLEGPATDMEGSGMADTVQMEETSTVIVPGAVEEVYLPERLWSKVSAHLHDNCF